MNLMTLAVVLTVALIVAVVLLSNLLADVKALKSELKRITQEKIRVEVDLCKADQALQKMIENLVEIETNNKRTDQRMDGPRAGRSTGQADVLAMKRRRGIENDE